MDQKEHEYNSRNCLSLEELKAYLNEDLPEGKKAKILAHLKSCELCHDALDGIFELMQKNDIDLKVSSLRRNIRKRSESAYYNKGKLLYHKNFHKWITSASIAACLIIIVGTFYYIHYSWNKYSIIEAKKYELKNDVQEEERPINNNENIIIPARFEKGEEEFKIFLKRQIKKEKIDFGGQNIVLVFEISEKGVVKNVRLPNILDDTVCKKIENIIHNTGKWYPATKNDIRIDSEVEIIIPVI